jgi:hypothetical protein
LRLTKRIGSTTYKVAVYFSGTSKETMGDKLLRLMKTETAGTRETPMAIPNPDSKNQVPQTRPAAGKRKT